MADIVIDTPDLKRKRDDGALDEQQDLTPASPSKMAKTETEPEDDVKSYEAIWDFRYEERRGGKLSGLFIATFKDVERCSGKTVYLGEALGKHSDVSFDFDENVYIVTDDPALVAAQRTIFELAGGTIGYNIVERVLEQLEEEEVEVSDDAVEEEDDDEEDDEEEEKEAEPTATDEN